MNQEISAPSSQKSVTGPGHRSRRRRRRRPPL